MILITMGIGLSMLNIENAQLITGPVAYLLILLGCIQMKQEGRSFEKTIPYAAVMLGLRLLVVVLSVISVAAALVESILVRLRMRILSRCWMEGNRSSSLSSTSYLLTACCNGS